MTRKPVDFRDPTRFAKTADFARADYELPKPGMSARALSAALLVATFVLMVAGASFVVLNLLGAFESAPVSVHQQEKDLP